MDKLYFEIPSINRKEYIVEYINEFAEYKSDLNGIGSLDKILECYTFEEALEALNFNYFACIDAKVMYEGIECYKTVARTSFYAEVYGK
jgi:hypothetical protein